MYNNNYNLVILFVKNVKYAINVLKYVLSKKNIPGY
jgi:hypothetical protein